MNISTSLAAAVVEYHENVLGEYSYYRSSSRQAVDRSTQRPEQVDKLLKGKMAKTKTQPLGICDFCLEPIPADLGEYTSKGKPRLYCSRQCMNTGNSRDGNEVRTQKLKERIKRDQWVNPADINPPNPENVGRGVSRKRKAEVKAGTWRNPALTDDARRKLSRPRVHTDDPVLHSAIEKLGRGLSVSDLTEEEAEAHRAHRRSLHAARRDKANAWYRNWYRKNKNKK